MRLSIQRIQNIFHIISFLPKSWVDAFPVWLIPCHICSTCSSHLMWYSSIRCTRFSISNIFHISSCLISYRSAVLNIDCRNLIWDVSLFADLTILPPCFGTVHSGWLSTLWIFSFVSGLVFLAECLTVTPLLIYYIFSVFSSFYVLHEMWDI